MWSIFSDLFPVFSIHCDSAHNFVYSLALDVMEKWSSSTRYSRHQLNVKSCKNCLSYIHLHRQTEFVLRTVVKSLLQVSEIPPMVWEPSCAMSKWFWAATLCCWENTICWWQLQCIPNSQFSGDIEQQDIYINSVHIWNENETYFWKHKCCKLRSSTSQRELRLIICGTVNGKTLVGFQVYLWHSKIRSYQFNESVLKLDHPYKWR